MLKYFNDYKTRFYKLVVSMPNVFVVFGVIYLVAQTSCRQAAKEPANSKDSLTEEAIKVPAVPVFESFQAALLAMRNNKDISMVSNGIIEGDKIKEFKGLKYFAPDSTFIIKANFALLKPEKVILKTTDERAPVYYKFCKLTFIHAGASGELFGYVENPEKPESIFIPFKDATSNHESYGGGRYMDLSYNGEKTMIMLDFNYAYNPYCHYNHNYSCPLVPVENVLSMAISAGEKKLYN